MVNEENLKYENRKESTMKEWNFFFYRFNALDVPSLTFCFLIRTKWKHCKYVNQFVRKVMSGSDMEYFQYANCATLIRSENPGLPPFSFSLTQPESQSSVTVKWIGIHVVKRKDERKGMPRKSDDASWNENDMCLFMKWNIQAKWQCFMCSAEKRKG